MPRQIVREVIKKMLSLYHFP